MALVPPSDELISNELLAEGEKSVGDGDGDGDGDDNNSVCRETTGVVEIKVERKSEAHSPQSDELISDEWLAEVKKRVGEKDGDGDGNNLVCRESMRVPGFVAKVKPAAYYPQIVAMGPYYHRALADAALTPHPLSRVSHMEMDKLNSLKSAARHDIRNFHKKTVLPSKSKLEQFYNWKMDSEEGFQKFGWMMTVDAFFLHHFLKKECVNVDKSQSTANQSARGCCSKQSPPAPHGSDTESTKQSPYHQSARGSIKCDIVKLENQIPLFLLKEVYHTLTRNDDTPNKDIDVRFDLFLKKRMGSLCSFEKLDYSSQENVGEEQHLLVCMHKCVSSFLRMDEEERDGSCFQKSQIAIGESVSMACRTCCFPQGKTGPKDFKMNAAKLSKHGITLMPFTDPKNSNQTMNQTIRFDRYSATLYLPRIRVSDMFTEVVLRNLLALEFVESCEEAVVTRYVELMKSLINTAKDVKVLRKRGVIVPGSSMITDDYIAAMWKDIRKPFFAASLHPSPHFENIKAALHRHYYIVKGKGVCLAKSFCLVQTPFRLIKEICRFVLV